MAGLLQELEVAARAEGLKVQLVPASTPDDIAGAFASRAPRRVTGCRQ
jgi:hypothetical protein